MRLALAVAIVVVPLNATVAQKTDAALNAISKRWAKAKKMLAGVKDAAIIGTKRRQVITSKRYQSAVALLNAVIVRADEELRRTTKTPATPGRKALPLREDTLSKINEALARVARYQRDVAESASKDDRVDMFVRYHKLLKLRVSVAMELGEVGTLLRLRKLVPVDFSPKLWCQVSDAVFDEFLYQEED